MLLEFSRDILEGWARICGVHLFLVWYSFNLNSDAGNDRDDRNAQ